MLKNAWLRDCLCKFRKVRSTWNFYCTEGNSERICVLRIEQCKALLAQVLDQMRKAHFRRVADMRKHGLAKECTANSDAVKAADEGLALPCLDRVCVAERVQSAVEPLEVLRNPRVGTACAVVNHLFEIGVSTHSEDAFSNEHADRASNVCMVERNDRTRIGRMPEHDVFGLRHREKARTVCLEQLLDGDQFARLRHQVEERVHRRYCLAIVTGKFRNVFTNRTYSTMRHRIAVALATMLTLSAAYGQQPEPAIAGAGRDTFDEEQQIERLRQKPLNWFGSLTFVYSQPRGNFKRFLDSINTSWGLGFSFNGGYKFTDVPVAIGADVGVLFYGSQERTYQTPLVIGGIPRTVYDTVNTSIVFIPITVLARIAPDIGWVQPTSRQELD